MTALPLTCVGKSVAPFTEVLSKITGESPHTALAETTYISTSDFVRSISAPPAWGRYISVTVKNNGQEPLLLQIGRLYEVGQEMLSTHIPAGETVTRTFEIADTDNFYPPKLGVRVSYYGGLTQDISITISATQFK